MVSLTNWSLRTEFKETVSPLKGLLWSSGTVQFISQAMVYNILYFQFHFFIIATLQYFRHRSRYQRL